MKSLVLAFLFLSSVAYADLAALRKYSETPGHVLSTRIVGGLNSDYGGLGAELSGQLLPHVQAHVGIGVGAQIRRGGGVRLTTNEFECLILKFCMSQLFIGVSATHGEKTEIPFEEIKEARRNYTIPENTYINANVGTITYFLRHFSSSFSVGYQKSLANADGVKFVGNDEDADAKQIANDKKLISSMLTGLQMNVGFGLSF